MSEWHMMNEWQAISGRRVMGECHVMSEYDVRWAEIMMSGHGHAIKTDSPGQSMIRSRG